MEDAALFYRHRAWTSFNGRRRYPFLSDEWRQQIEEARRFIRASRDLWDDRPRLITRTFYALGPLIREPLRDIRLPQGKSARETRTGADLIAALQASPYRDIDIEPERGATAKQDTYLVLNLLPPSRIEWLRQQSRRVAAVFRQARERERGAETMQHKIIEAIAHPDHTVSVTWAGCAHARVNLAPYLEKGGVFEALKDPEYFVREMRIMPGGIGLAWPNEVDFSADGLRESTCVDDETTEYGRYVTDNDPAPEDELYYVILRLVDQSCGQKHGDEFDSWAISAYELAIEELDQAGFVEIEKGGGRIYAKLTPTGRNFRAWMDAWRDAEDVWNRSEITPIPPGGPVNIMKHRHLVEGVGFIVTAIEDILERGGQREWVPLVQAIRADPYGEIAERTRKLSEQPRDPDYPLFGAPVFRRVIAKARKWARPPAPPMAPPP